MKTYFRLPKKKKKKRVLKFNGIVWLLKTCLGPYNGLTINFNQAIWNLNITMLLINRYSNHNVNMDKQ